MFPFKFSYVFEEKNINVFFSVSTNSRIHNHYRLFGAELMVVHYQLMSINLATILSSVIHQLNKLETTFAQLLIQVDQLIILISTLNIVQDNKLAMVLQFLIHRVH